MAYMLPALGYAYDALEPYIDAKTMEIHYTKHHQGYITNLNKTLEPYPDLQEVPLADLLKKLNTLPLSVRQSIQNFGGGHYNHSFFWPLMKKKSESEPNVPVVDEIKKGFGSLSVFQERFNAVAASVFGSGWAWLCVADSGQLKIISTANQDTPLALNLQPILGLDVWEHAYYLHYQNKRADYINAWWQVVNWQQVEENYRIIIDRT